MANPTCPHCNTEMVPKYFAGYYESFAMWSCACKVIPGSTIKAGVYSDASEGELIG